MTPARRRHLAMLAVWTNPVWQDRIAIIRKIADAVGADERRFQRTVGAEWTAAYRADWDTADRTLCMLTDPDRPETLTTFRPMRTLEAAQ
jgi:hypothetical protein